MGGETTRVMPMTIRSRVVLEIASELVADSEQVHTQAKVSLRTQGTAEWPLVLFGSSTVEGIEAVVKRQAALAIINPSGVLSLAFKGAGIFEAPQPVRTIGVIPSYDQLVFAVRPEFGLSSFEDIGRRRLPLKILGRGQEDHCLHLMIADVMCAAGFSHEQLLRYGGAYVKSGPPPYPDGSKFTALVHGDCDAVFDEAAKTWLGEALAAGMQALPLDESTVQKLEMMGYRRSWLKKADFPLLANDILTLDFSGWPIFVHENEDDQLVRQICQALDRRKHLIPWEGEGPLPLHMMVRETPSTPQLVPMHAAAAQYWFEKGYLS